MKKKKKRKKQNDLEQKNYGVETEPKDPQVATYLK